MTPIVFGVLLHDADEKWLGRNQLMLALSAHTKIVLLEKPRFSGRWIEWKKPRAERLGENLYVIRNAFGLRTQRLGKRFQPLTARIDGHWFKAALREVGITDYVYWLTVNEPSMLRGLPTDRLVYDCMDPNFFPDKQAEFDRSEAALVRQAKVVFCTAHILHRKMLALNPNSFLLPNAACQDTIQTVQAKDYECPAALQGRPRPFIGYMGTIDWRFDADFVYQSARALPEYTFALVGRINADQEAKIRPLRDLPNVVLTGQVGYEEGHAYNMAFDVGLIPFTPGPMNDAINSVKMFMYLAGGKPIVATDVEECRRNPYVETAGTPEAFAEAIRCVVAENSAALAKERMDFARANTWEHRAQAALEQLAASGLLREK